MSFFDSASLVQIPSGVKDGVLYSVKPIDGSGDLTFSRGSDIEATRVNANGYIEKAQVNLLTYSNDFSNAIWVDGAGSCTRTGGQAGYDGTNDAWLLTQDTDGYDSIINNTTAVTGVYTFSVYAKANTGNTKFTIRLSGTGSRVEFNLTGGSIGTIDNAIDAQIESVGSGWYRCSAAFNCSSDQFRITPQWASATAESVYIQDSQINYGLVAQTYQETTTAAVVSGITDNMPRLNYDPANPTCPSLLLEPSRQNLLAQSEYYGGSPYTVVNGSITNNDSQSPEGAVNATKLESTSNGTVTRLETFPTLADNSVYSISIFVKKGTANWSFLGLRQKDGSPTTNVFFDLQNGVKGSFASGTPIDYDIIDYGNDWYRCYLVVNSSSGVTAPRIQYGVGTGDGDFVSDIGDNVTMYGAALELGSHPTSYIPTYGSSATRTSESASKSGVASLIGSAAGTIYLEAAALANDLSERRFAVSNGTTGNVARVGFTTIDNRILAVLYNGSNQCVLSYSGADITQTNKIAFTWAENDFALFVNGVKRSSDTFGSTFAANTLTEIHFNEGDGAGNDMYGQFDKVLLFTSRLSDTSLATLTA